MKKETARLWPLTLTLILVIGHASETLGIDRDSTLATTRVAFGQPLDNYEFRNTRGARVALEDFRGKPLIISLIYTNCREIPPSTAKIIADIITKTRDALGADRFSILTVGFDASCDAPAMMKRFRSDLNVNDDGWQFLTADVLTIERLSTQLGFTYKPSSQGSGQQIQTSLINAEGKALQQIHGAKFTLPHLIDPLKKLVFRSDKDTGILTVLSNRIRYYCIVYDSATGTYQFEYFIILKFLIGFAILSMLGAQLIWEWRKALRQ